MFITLNKIFKRIKEWIFGVESPQIDPVNNIQEPLTNKVIMLNRSKRRYLAAKLNNAKHNKKELKNIKACRLPHRVLQGDLESICRLAGVSIQDVRNVGR